MNPICIILIIAVCLFCIIVGSVLLCRQQTHSFQIRLEKAHQDIERENARNRTIAEYRSKILDCIKSTKKDEYDDKQAYINKIEEYLKTI